MTRVAVVEDNPDNRLLLKAILGGRFDVQEFDNGVDALAAFSATLPDVLLLDISLPGMDGVEILSRIRGDAALAKLPVIALTAHAMAGDREKYMACGFDDYLTKPIIDEQLLVRAIERQLNGGA